MRRIKCIESYDLYIETFLWLELSCCITCSVLSIAENRGRTLDSFVGKWAQWGGIHRLQTFLKMKKLEIYSVKRAKRRKTSLINSNQDDWMLPCNRE